MHTTPRWIVDAGSALGRGGVGTIGGPTGPTAVHQSIPSTATIVLPRTRIHSSFFSKAAATIQVSILRRHADNRRDRDLGFITLIFPHLLSALPPLKISSLRRLRILRLSSAQVPLDAILLPGSITVHL